MKEKKQKERKEKENANIPNFETSNDDINATDSISNASSLKIPKYSNFSDEERID